MVGSMSRQGNCYDNACMESWPRLITKEWISLRHFPTREDARSAIFAYLAICSNRQRLPSALGYRTPADAAQAALTA